MEEKNLTKGQKAYLKRVVNEFRKNATSMLEEIEELKLKFIEGNEENPSLLEKFKDSESALRQIKSEITTLHKDIFVPKIQGQSSLSENIIEFTDKFKKTRNEIDEIKNEIEEYSIKLFGDVDDESKDSIRNKIDHHVKNLNQLHSTHQQKQENLFNEIEKLLKGASTVALSKSFKEHKDSFNTANYMWMFLFVLSIVSMMGVSLYIFNYADYELKDMWKGTIGNLPFIGGAIWIAIYASKQRSQNKRLQQEYAFKEDVAKIYYGLKKEIEELDDTDLGKQLNKKILEVIVDVVSSNPSDTLESHTHNDKGPILEAISNLSTIVKGRK